MSKTQVQHILDRLKQEDSQVLASLYKTNRTPFLKFANKYNLNEDDLLDIYQDSILAFYDNVRFGKLTQLDCSIKTYIFSIGKFMIFKKLKALSKVDDTPIDFKRLETYYHEATSETISDIDLKHFNAGFKKLGSQCQELLKLFYYQGLSLTDIQNELNYDNYNVVKSQKSRCLKHLKSLVEKEQNG